MAALLVFVVFLVSIAVSIPIGISMKDMEDELGVELFEKKGRNVKLTKYGEIFLPHEGLGKII